MLNVNGLTSKDAHVARLAAALERRLGRKIDILGLVETKLASEDATDAADAPVLSGFHLVGRCDREGDGGGGGVAVYTRDTLLASVVDGPRDDASESVCVRVGVSPRAPRFLVCYRAPQVDAAPLFRVIQHHADECGGVGAPLVVGGDLN